MQVPEMQKFKLSEGMSSTPSVITTSGPPTATSGPIVKSRFFTPSPTRPTRPPKLGGLRKAVNSPYPYGNSINSVKRKDSVMQRQKNRLSGPWRALVRTTPLKGLLQSIF